MKKLYSKKLGGEAFALDAAQLDTLKKAGYTVPSPEEVIADAAAVKIEPPEGKRAYVVFDFKTGAFRVRTRTQTLAESEVGGFVGEVVSAAILCGFVERADMDNPKADAPATPTTASPLVNMIRDAFLRAANNKTAPAAEKPTMCVLEWARARRLRIPMQSSNTSTQTYLLSAKSWWSAEHAGELTSRPHRLRRACLKLWT